MTGPSSGSESGGRRECARIDRSPHTPYSTLPVTAPIARSAVTHGHRPRQAAGGEEVLAQGTQQPGLACSDRAAQFPPCCVPCVSQDHPHGFVAKPQQLPDGGAAWSRVPAFPCPRACACASRCAWPLGLARPAQGRGRPMTGRYGAASGASSQPSLQALPIRPLALADQRSGARRVPPPPHGAPCRHRLAEPHEMGLCHPGQGCA